MQLGGDLRVDAVAFGFRLGGKLFARLLRDAGGIGTRIRERLLVVGERLVGIALEAGCRIDIALDPVAALFDHLADARQCDLLT